MPAKVVRLNKTILASLYLSGFRFVLFTSSSQFGLVTPMVDDLEVPPPNSYSIPILEREVIEMAEGEAPFPVFVKVM